MLWKIKKVVQESVENNSFLGIDVIDFQSPCLTLRDNTVKSAQYSDISDDEFVPHNGTNR